MTPEILGPGNDTKKLASKRPDDSHRIHATQKRTDDLEKAYNDGKKSLQSEIERLRLELARSQKSTTELNDRLEKLKKQNAAQEHRIEELKRNALSDKAEIKDLGVKLRLSEHQRSQVTAKHGDLAELKKAMSSLEARRRDELKEKERATGELEKTLGAEKKKKELVEGQLRDMKAKSEAEVANVKKTIDSLKAELVQTLEKLTWTEEEAGRVRQQVMEREKMLAQVATEHGRLFTTSVSKSVHERLVYKHSALQIQTNRLARKLSNTEGQVSELVHLIRQGKEERDALRGALRSAEDELSFYSSVIKDNQDHSSSVDPISSLHNAFIDTIHDAYDFEVQHKSLVLQCTIQQATLHQDEREEMLSAFTMAEEELKEVTAARDNLEVQTQEARHQCDITQELLQATTLTANGLKASSEVLKSQVAELTSKLEEERVSHGAAMKKEKDSVQRLTATVQKARMAEEGLRSEIDELTTDLMKAAQFEEAYYCLSEEVESLLARNTLAEDEAHRLSQFNAEILGHHNPAQRIMYVERIRNELADTKQKLTASTRSLEAVTDLNNELQQELDTYKSVMVPPENKPKTNMTRVTRPPLLNLNQGSS
ncbi:hypothetical protein D9758_001834 [Tetrapyrgos nigripes]|uniref:Uncharacterized protein n=1 Tax=Tetrapyrgos nigripes TaxID=182062 RepID=A0A8H5GTW5_9AGAR|nr:hypothetical protein D9758_001834 [Tetrapyrgos nigripes]